MSSPELGDSIETLAAATARAVDRRVADGAVEDVPLESAQELLCAAVRLYGAKADGTETVAAFPPGVDVTATDVARTATAMLTAAQLEVFELGMWQVWNGK